jgi:peptide/nickel transport system permease protein
MFALRVARHVGLLGLVLVLGGFIGATLARFSPGFDVDEQELDSRLSVESREALRKERAGESSVAGFYLRYLGGMLGGDLGRSRSFGRPVRELLAERSPATLRLVGAGLLIAWGLAAVSALVAGLSRAAVPDLVLGWASGALLTLPAALLAFAFLYLGVPVYWAMAAVLGPRVFRFLRNLLVEARGMPHVLAARARGVPEAVLVRRHILPHVAPRMVALAGASVSMALAADVPVEVLSDVPGVGQLAWQAASGRDLPLLVSLTMALTALIVTANGLSDLATALVGRRRP